MAPCPSAGSIAAHSRIPKAWGAITSRWGHYIAEEQLSSYLSNLLYKVHLPYCSSGQKFDLNILFVLVFVVKTSKLFQLFLDGTRVFVFVFRIGGMDRLRRAVCQEAPTSADLRRLVHRGQTQKYFRVSQRQVSVCLRLHGSPDFSRE